MAWYTSADIERGDISPDLLVQLIGRQKPPRFLSRPALADSSPESQWFCNNYANWSSWECTLSDNTDDYMSGDSNGTSSMKITKDSGNYTYGVCWITTPTQDWTDAKYLVCRYMVHSGTGASDPERIVTLKVKVSTDTGGSPSNWRSYTLFTSGAGGEGNYQRRYYDKWRTIVLPMGNYGSSSGSFDIADVRQILFELACTAKTDTGAVTIDYLGAYQGNTNAIAIIRFDDCYTSQYDEGCYLTGLGLRACYGVIGGLAGQGTNDPIMTAAQLKDLQDQGHLMINHSWTNDTAQDIAASTLKDYYMRNAEWMVDNGIGGGHRVLLLPGGYTSGELEDELEDIADVIWYSRNLAEKASADVAGWDQRRLAGLNFDGSAAAISKYGATTRITKDITSFATANAGSRTLVNCAGHGFTDGSIIDITGSSVADYNDKWVIEQIDANSFEIGIAFNGDGGASTAATGTAWYALDDAITDKAIFIPYVHQVGPPTFDANHQAIWRAMMDRIAAKVASGDIINRTPIDILEANV